MRKYKSNKGRLVKGYIPPISIKFLEFPHFRNKMLEMLSGNIGLYILYKNEDLYYVGITGVDLYGRLRQHMRDKHRSQWDKFSVFIIKKGGYLKDIESMAHLISNPPANILKGRFREHYQYDDKIKEMVKEVSDIIDEIKKRS